MYNPAELCNMTVAVGWMQRHPGICAGKIRPQRRSSEGATVVIERHGRLVHSSHALRRVGLLAAVVVIGLVPARNALSWRRILAANGAPVHWSNSALQQLNYAIDASGLPEYGLTTSAVTDAVDAAFASWQAVACAICATSTDGAPCTSENACGNMPIGVRISDLGPHAPGPIGMACSPTSAGLCDPMPDGNQVLFIHDASAWPFGRHVIAMTVVSVKANDSEIVDADVTLNAAGFSFCVDDCGPGQAQLGAVVLHEAGHFLGLDHSDEADAVMYAQRPVERQSMGALMPDDVAGICAVFPAAQTPTVCTAPAPSGEPPRGASGCASARAPGSRSTAALLAIALAFALRRRFFRA